MGGRNSPVQVQVRIEKCGTSISRPIRKSRPYDFATLIMRKSSKVSAWLKSPEEWRRMFLSENFKTVAFHMGIVLFCLVYVSVGALILFQIERPLELDYAQRLAQRLSQKHWDILVMVKKLRFRSRTKEEFEARFTAELSEHESFLFSEFGNPITANYFDSLVYNNASYIDMWTISSAFLLATTTIIPVGFGFITPRSFGGRLLLVSYAICGIPLALVTISDVGRFLCNFIFRLFKQSTKTAIWLLILIAVLYPLIGGLIIWRYSTLNLVDSYYYCITTSLTIGFGDLTPPLPTMFLIFFIVCGVILMSISIEVVGSNVIHHIHYMGRQVGRAGQVAGRFLQIAQLNINTGLGAGMTQLSNFARLGFVMMPSSISDRNRDDSVENEECINKDETSAFEPRIPGIEFVDFADFD